MLLILELNNTRINTRMYPNKIIKKCYEIYEKAGQYGVYKYAETHRHKFKPIWELCEPCEDKTPTILNDDSCSVCGTQRK